MRFVAGRDAVAELLLAWAPWRRAIGNMLLARALQRRVCVEEVAAPRKPMRHQRKSLLLPLRSTAWHHREAHASREKQCEQGEAVRAGRSNANRDKQCGLLVDEDGEVVPSEYLLRHALELCGCETLYFGTGGLHWLYVAEDHH